MNRKPESTLRFLLEYALAFALIVIIVGATAISTADFAASAVHCSNDRCA